MPTSDVMAERPPITTRTTPGRSGAYVLDAPGDGVTIARRGEEVTIGVDASEDNAVRRAVADLARDLERVAAVRTSTSASAAGARIVVGTIGHSPIVDTAVREGRLDVSALQDVQGRPRWEAYLVSVVDGVLYLVGADRRGTIYAIYDFTATIGVSAWAWWGDVPVRPRDHITVDPQTHVADWPSVRYRGVFLNDEEELYHWAIAHTGDGTVGPETYARVYELILRLKGNYLWPAMHVGAFNHDPENGRLAHDMGVVIGTSHCDMLLRSNEHEFRPWATERGEDVAYDYSIDGRNRELLREYWRGSVAQNRDYEVTWTVGMRGVHDSGFLTSAIDEDATLSEDEKIAARVRLLETVIDDQRTLLTEGLSVPSTSAPQIFIPYKEVLPLYDAALEVPDDVTIVWANDSFGHIRRFPDDLERRRTGGHGLYYHSSYWSNYTTSYLASSSTPLALMKNELRKAWESGIRELWVDNIGGLKPLEIEMEFFLRSAWEAGRETSTADVPEFTAEWIDEKFSGGHGEKAGLLYAEYYQLNNQRKIEHLASDAFPQVGYGDEAGRRLAELRRVYDETNEIGNALPEDERDAFFQLFAIKIHMAYLSSAEFYYADRSVLASRQGKAAAADRYLAVSRTFADSVRALIDFYNHRMSRGRWNGMFTPHAFPPPVMPMHPAAAPALRIGAPGLGVVVWGESAPVEAPRMTLAPAGTTEKWIEVFNSGAGSIRFTIDADPWIEVGQHPDSVATETRIPIRAAAAGTVRVVSPDTGESVTILIEEARGGTAPADFLGALESDGSVSIDPSLPDAITSGRRSRWVLVPHLGRYGNAAIQPEPHASSGDASAELGFDIHLTTPGAHLLEVHRLPTLNSTGRIRIGAGVDDFPPVVLESATTDEHRGAWSQAVQDNVEKLRVRLPWLSAGAHRLRLRAIDDHVPISKIVVYTREPGPSNLGPEFSTHTGRPDAGAADPDPSRIDIARIRQEAHRLYGASAAPIADQVYAGAGFWTGQTTFRLPEAVAQTALGAPVDVTAPDGRKDVVAALGSGVIREADGVIAFETEYALANTEHAWTTADALGRGSTWTHTQAETGVGGGLAMHVRPRGILWPDPDHAPGLHYAIAVSTPGRYRAWLLVKFDDDQDDSCVIAVDGHPQPLSQQFSGGELCEYGLRQTWIWVALSDVELTVGAHTFAILARKSGLRIDRVYLTLGAEFPPIDAQWTPSSRTT